MSRWLAVLAVFLMFLAAVPAVAVTLAPATAAGHGSQFHIDSGGSPFVSVGSGYGTFTIAATSGDTLIVFEWDTQFTPSDSQGNSFNDVENGVGGLVAIWNTTLTATDTDTVTIHTGDPSSYAGWGVTVAGGAAGRTLASGTNSGYSATPSSQSVNAVALFISSQHTGSCSTSGGTAWDVVPACLTLANFYIGSFSQNVTANVVPELSVNATGGTLDDWAWMEIPAPESVPPAPTGLTGWTTAPGYEMLVWTQSAGGGIVNNTVELFFGDACAGVPRQFSTAGAATTYVVTAITSAPEYSVKVTSWNGTGESDPSGCFAFAVLPYTLVQTTSATCSTDFYGIVGALLIAEAVYQNNVPVSASPPTDAIGNTFTFQSGFSTSYFLYGNMGVSVWTTTVTEAGTQSIDFCAASAQFGAVIVAQNGTLLADGHSTYEGSGSGNSVVVGIQDVDSYIVFAAGGQNSTCPASASWTPYACSALTDYSFTANSFVANGTAGLSTTITTTDSYLFPWAQFSAYFTPPATVPPAPTSLSVGEITETSAQATWTQSTGGGIVNNTVFLFSGGGCGGTPTQFSTGGAATHYDFTGLDDATEYSVKVSSWNMSGQSPLSSCVDFSTLTPVVSPSLTVSGISENTFDEVYSNGTWTNITTLYIIVSNSYAMCVADSATYGGWTWAAYTADEPYIPRTAIVSYYYNSSNAPANTSFVNDSTVWVGLYVATSASFTGVFSCQEVTFTSPVPPPFVPSVDPIPIIITGGAISIVLFCLYKFRQLRKKNWV
jgi:hypothetical protein